MRESESVKTERNSARGWLLLLSMPRAIPWTEHYLASDTEVPSELLLV